MIPSWLKWQPNCCETRVGPWVRLDEYTGRCEKHDSLEHGTITDTRFRCPSFLRKTDDTLLPKDGTP